MKENRRCNFAKVLIFACSGSSDADELKDRTARRLVQGESGRIYSLPVINDPISKYIIIKKCF